MNRREFLAAAAAAPLLVRTPAAFAGGMPAALVTADTEESVAVVYLTTGRVVERISTLPGPRSIERVGWKAAVVAHTDEGAVTILDAISLRIRRVLQGFGEPRYTASSPDGRYAYVTDSSRGELAVVGLERSRLVHRTEVGGPARHLGIDVDGQTLWVALGTKAPELAVLSLAEPARPRLLRTIRPPFLAHDVGFAPDGRVWVTSGDRGSIAVYDPRTREVEKVLGADRPPQHVTFTGRAAYVTSGDDGTLRVHALGGRLLRRTKVPVGSYNVQDGWGMVFTPSLSLGTLCVLRSSGKLWRRVEVAPSSHDACFVMAA